MNWSAYFHLTSVWLFRIAIAAGVAGVVYLYLTKPDSGRVDASVAPPAIAGPDARAFPPCQPLGRTASGKLVYSMDCETVPDPSRIAGARAPDAADAAGR
ncbi:MULTISPECIES: hypothetical protein [Rhodopseudomonas]|uniref:Uncharacterized protein n=1 Tax=Rhodopseudomonas palustris TaxID=1076 RepID=A0A0D7F3T1_RHOPL|nr:MULTISPECIES: hypothetical protein [Rhodopseudomonas]KIZ47709.1 hypothetical protein OO17_02870 [Rhodopseudomonas palustris]MDF3811595.1 hypothetical protein [Rhodopseudomonas sp. BAL398]WOK19917.1 hypothetical protein RBJ75_10530 [Rhodopseudomonas sp. BAL398]